MEEDKEIKAAMMARLKWDYDRARSTCDPIEFQRRYQNLIHTLVDVVLDAYDTKPNSSEASQV